MASKSVSVDFADAGLTPGARKTLWLRHMIDHTLDARGLKCPLPILLARKTLRAMPSGAVLELLATDRGVDADVADLCEMTGAVLLEASTDADVQRFLLRAVS